MASLAIVIVTLIVCAGNLSRDNDKLRAGIDRDPSKEQVNTLKRRRKVRFLKARYLAQEILDEKVMELQEDGWTLDKELSNGNGLLAFYKYEEVRE